MKRIPAAQTAAFVAACVLAVATAPGDRWDMPTLYAIAGFTFLSGITHLPAPSQKVDISGTFLGLMLAAVLLGGAPAALIGVLINPVIWLRTRESRASLTNNIVVYACFPLLAGIFFHVWQRMLGLESSDIGYYLLVFATFAIALTLNFLGSAGYQCLRDESPLSDAVKGILLPILPAELFSALLTMAAVWVSVRTGTVGIAMLGLIFLIFEYLVGELLRSKARAEELRRRATTDDLTGLANRERFRDRLHEEIAVADGRPFAVMLVDLDRFKEINDTLGHHYGDELLRELGPRLAALVDEDGLVARLGGDEFALLPGMHTEDPVALEDFALEIARAIEQPALIDEMTLEVGASIGIAVYPRDGEDPHGLLRSADVAMYAAKEAHTPAKIYEVEDDRNSVGHLYVLSEFRRALVADQVVVHFQPIVDVDYTQVRAAEGLVRWEHPKRGLLSPAAFMGAVEQTGLSGPVTQHVLERAIAACASWRTHGDDLSVAVNLSVRNLLDRRLPREVERLLSLYSLPPCALKLEITESMLMTDPERAIAVVVGLNDLGVQISVDDFGTGYSSLANLRKLPISELKIDRSFVSPMLDDDSDMIIVRSTINLGHDLGLRVVAEGVEDENTLRSLDLLGCDFAQGYHISRPLSPEAFSRWVIDARPPELQNREAWAGAVVPPPGSPAAASARHSGPS